MYNEDLPSSEPIYNIFLVANGVDLNLVKVICGLLFVVKKIEIIIMLIWLYHNTGDISKWGFLNRCLFYNDLSTIHQHSTSLFCIRMLLINYDLMNLWLLWVSGGLSHPRVWFDVIVLGPLNLQSSFQLLHTSIRFLECLIKFLIDENMILIGVLQVLYLFL